MFSGLASALRTVRQKNVRRAALRRREPHSRGSLTFAPCESLGYVTFPKSLTCRYPSSLLWEESHEVSKLVHFAAADISTVCANRFRRRSVQGSFAQILASASSDLLRGARASVSVAARALVVAAAGPSVLPYGAAAIAFVLVDESRLAAPDVSPLVGAVRFLRHCRGPGRSRSQWPAPCVG